MYKAGKSNNNAAGLCRMYLTTEVRGDEVEGIAAVPEGSVGDESEVQEGDGGATDVQEGR